MIYIIDNGLDYSEHCYYFVEAPEDFGEWFMGDLMPWYQARDMIDSRMKIVASTPVITWRDKNATVGYEDFLGEDGNLNGYDLEDPPTRRPTYRGV